MPTPSPRASTIGKLSSGASDCRFQGDVLKFMGASVLSVNASVGWNSVPSSLSLQLVEDDGPWDEPEIGSLWGFSLPKESYFAVEPKPDLDPDSFDNLNVPFYFCGILTDKSYDRLSSSAKTISVTLTDPREVLGGCQCLCGGFGMSQNVESFSNNTNIIDIFGYHDYGWSSDRNEFGMPWYKIKEAIEGVGITMYGIQYEFLLSGTPFNEKVPDFYRMNENVTDLMSILQKVSQDAGSDFLCIPRKIGTNLCTIEFRAIDRNNTDFLTEGELQAFVDANNGYVTRYTKGRNLRNEPTSSIITGGWRNCNYLAYPSQYQEEFHLSQSGGEDITKFPTQCEIRMFGGDWESTAYDVVSSDEENYKFKIQVESKTNDVSSGAILPFWGFDPFYDYYPLLEPFLPLDSYVWDKDSSQNALFKEKIPLCKIEQVNKQVRQVEHSRAFVEGDEQPDTRPFSTLTGYIISPQDQEGYVRGLPLNTEILKSSLISFDFFMSTYFLYYPDIVTSIGYGTTNFRQFYEEIANKDFPDKDKPKLIEQFIRSRGLFYFQYNGNKDFVTSSEKVNKDSTDLPDAEQEKELNKKELFARAIYDSVRNYASQNYGRRFLISLPRSYVMHRIWNNQSVPTNIDRPEIEYVVDQSGYWQDVPPELDGVYSGSTGTTFDGNEEIQIRRRFMLEDGRFGPMAVVNARPRGNASFLSNGIYRSKMEDLQPADYAPNIITSGPKFFFVTCSVQQVERRPDLAVLNLPNPVSFDFENKATVEGYERALIYEQTERILWQFYQKDAYLRQIMKVYKTDEYQTQDAFASSIIVQWAYNISQMADLEEARTFTDYVLDLQAASIPLTSSRVKYGPWYPLEPDYSGMRSIQEEPDLVPWNFARSEPWYLNLDQAGFSRLGQSISNVTQVDYATITVAKPPEFGLGSSLGYNSNLTGISISMGNDGFLTSYSFSTWKGLPGSYRKVEYDLMYNSARRSKPKFEDPIGVNVASSVKDQLKD